MLTPIERGLVRLAASRAGAWVYVNVLTHIDRVLLRASRGRLSSAAGTSFHPHIVLLRTVGVRTGRPRDVPLLALIDGPRVVLIASRGGHARHPAGYHNLRAHPRALVTVQGQTRSYVARPGCHVGFLSWCSTRRLSGRSVTRRLDELLDSLIRATSEPSARGLLIVRVHDQARRPITR